MKIILASRSPRRQQLLAQIGIEFELIDVEVNEDWDGIEIPKNYVQRIALEKACAAKSKVHNKLPILAADTSVVLDNFILGKAETKEEAAEMLGQLSGRMHHVFTAVALITEIEQVCLNINHVSFRPLSESDILQYCETEEPLGKAGAYAIQGKAAAFVERLEGSYSGVMGLPLYEVAEMLRKLRQI